MVAGAVRVRTTIGITGCSRIDSLSTASSQASSPSSAAAVVRASSARVAAQLVERPGERGRGGLVAGEEQGDELVAQLLVGEAVTVARLGAARISRESTSVRVGQVGRRTPLADLGVDQLVELVGVLLGPLARGRTGAAAAPTSRRGRPG